MTDYYVRPTNGLDTNAGTTFATAFQTTQKALDTATAGDSILLCAEAAETTAVQIDIDTNNGTAAAPIKMEGRDSTDGTTPATYTLQASATITALIARTSTFGYRMEFKDIIFNANSNAGFAFDDNDVNNIAQDLTSTFHQCRFTSGTSDGYSTELVGITTFYECEFDNNGGIGYTGTNLNDGHGYFHYCSFHDNTSHGAFMDDADSGFSHCESYANGGAGFYAYARADAAYFNSCTSFNNTNSGFYFHDSANPLWIANNSSSSNGGYGFEFSTTTADTHLQMADHNHTYNNTSGITNLTVGLPGDNNKTGDPQFTNTTAGSEDLRPANGSPLDSTGIFGLDIGARRSVDPAGGGGGAIVNQGLHAIESGITT